MPLNVWEERFIFVNILSIYKYTINKKFLAFINCIYQDVLHVFSFISAHIWAIGRWEFGSRDQRFRSIHQSCIYARISERNQEVARVFLVSVFVLYYLCECTYMSRIP